MNCSKCEAVLVKGAKFCPDCGAKSEVHVEAKTQPTCQACNARLTKAAKFCPDCGNEVPKEHTAKARKANGQNKNLDSTIEPDSGKKTVFFSLIALAIVGVIVYASSAGGGISSTQSSNSSGVTPNQQTETTTPDGNANDSMENMSPLDACLEYGALGATAAGYDCPPSASTVKGSLVESLSYYCSNPAGQALDESNWTLTSPVPNNDVYTLQSITVRGTVVWFQIDVSNKNYAQVYAGNAAAESFLDDWGCPPPGPFIVLKN